MSENGEVSWSTDMNSVSSLTRHEEAMPLSSSNSSDAGRDPSAVIAP